MDCLPVFYVADAANIADVAADITWLLFSAQDTSRSAHNSGS